MHLSFTSFHSYSVVNEIFLEAIKLLKSAISLGIQIPSQNLMTKQINMEMILQE